MKARILLISDFTESELDRLNQTIPAKVELPNYSELAFCSPEIFKSSVSMSLA